MTRPSPSRKPSNSDPATRSPPSWSGSTASRAGDPEGALPWLDNAHGLDNERIDALIYRIEALTQLGRHDQAEEAYYLAQQIAPEHPEIYAAMAESLLARDLHEKAVWCLREAARLDPTLPRVEAKLAEAYARTGRLERARQLYLRELRRDAGNVETLLDLGELLLDMHRDAEASEKFRRVLELEPDNADAHFNLGRLASSLGDRAEATRQFDLVVRLDPSYPSARCRLAAELLDAGGTAARDRARQLLVDELGEQSERSDRFSIEDMDELGQLLLDASMPTEAARVFRRMIARRPNHAAAHHALSVCHFLRKDRVAGMESAPRRPAAGAPLRLPDAQPRDGLSRAGPVDPRPLLGRPGPAAGARRPFAPPAAAQAAGAGGRRTRPLDRADPQARQTPARQRLCLALSSLAASSTSLSPRPEQLITTCSSSRISIARRMPSATAWAVSSAGMIPSARARCRNASSA
ncbi:MAG: tetratricopeptide repeat protein [Planctomycetota bacterium]|nr:MAG: tetratricopeptide repeat protein [Planctomycetota bacterium]